MPLAEDRRSYAREIRTSYYEGDIKNRVKLSNIMRHMQQTGAEHLDALGMTYEDLYAQGKVMLLKKMEIRFKRVPLAGETFTNATSPHEPIKAQFIRYHMFKDQKGEVFMESFTTWLLVDVQSRKVLRPSAANLRLNFSEMGGTTTLDRHRMPDVPDVKVVGSRETRFSDIDCNGHLTNAVYGDIICDFLPPGLVTEKEIECVIIHFDNEAKMGQTLDIGVGMADESTHYVAGNKRDGGNCFQALINFK